MEPKKSEEEGSKILKEIMAEDSPNLGRDLNIQVCVAHRSPRKFSLKMVSPRHIVIYKIQ